LLPQAANNAVLAAMTTAANNQRFFITFPSSGMNKMKTFSTPIVYHGFEALDFMDIG
jgi:hypothetical protein